MSRPLRIEYENAWYHVMNRGRGGESIFQCAEDYQEFLKICQESIKLFRIRVGCCCLMKNHYHLLINTPGANLSRCMRHINGVYTQRYNRKYKSDGQLFRGRYKSIIVSEDNYLLEVMRYIHNNPVKAGVVKNVKDYEWCSHKGFLSEAKKWDWVYKDLLLSLLSPKRDVSKKLYKEFLSKSESQEIINCYNNKKAPIVIGSEKFMEWLKNKYYGKKNDLEIPESLSLSPESKRILQEVSREYKIKESELYISKRGTENEPRSVALYLIRTMRGEKLTEISKLFKIKKYSTTSSSIERMKMKLLSEKKMRRKIKKIKLSIVALHESRADLTL